MTILNHPSDGLHSELIALARTVAFEGKIDEESLLKVCANPGSHARISGSLNRWSRLGLFERDGEKVQLNKQFSIRRGQSVDDWTEVLPIACRKLALDPTNCLPLWGESQGVSADFAKGVAWLLAQDIFRLPRAYENGLERLETTQIRGEKIIQNNTRLSGLRFWARYCGFATGDGSSFFMDPTRAIRSVIGDLRAGKDLFDAKTFVTELAGVLPVLDGGSYRSQVEERLESSVWRTPPAKHLSLSLSFALRRLDLEKALILESKADAEDGFWLSGADYRTVSRFTHVRLPRVRR